MLRRSRRSLQLLGTVYQKEDATLVEVNPLVKTGDGRIVALDAKVSLDENAAFRHPDHAALADESAEDPLEAAARPKASTTSSSTAPSESSAMVLGW